MEMVTQHGDDDVDIDIAIIPPAENGQVSEGEEEILNGHQQMPRDVAGELEVHIHDENKPSTSNQSRHWSRSDTVKLSPNCADILALDEKFPLLCEKTCYDVFRLFCDNDMIDLIIQESERYAHEIKNSHDYFTNRGEMLTFIGVLLYSGYVRFPNETHYWSTCEDFNNSMCSEYIQRDRFKKMKSCLHFADNNNLMDSKAAKIQPLLSILNQKLLQFGVFSTELAIDESMVPYFGHHSSKMFISGKPIRFGYKLWSMCSPDGYPFYLNIYCGRASNTPSPTPLGENVVRQCIAVCEDPQMHHFFFDNFFSSVSLLEKLADENIRATGTIRRNRTAKCPLQEEKDFKKTERGTHDFLSTGKVVVISWNDNRVVNVISNVFQCEPLQQCSRYSTRHKERINIRQPHAIKRYNQFMGGVDLYDRLLGSYRPTINGKKWWWNLWIHIVNTCVVASWRAYCRLNPQSAISHLDFLREVTMTLLKQQPARRRLGGPTAASVDSVRFDSANHYIASAKQGRCVLCKRNTTKCCNKCKKLLHEKCFIDYHTR